MAQLRLVYVQDLALPQKQWYAAMPVAAGRVSAALQLMHAAAPSGVEAACELVDSCKGFESVEQVGSFMNIKKHIGSRKFYMWLGSGRWWCMRVLEGHGGLCCAGGHAAPVSQPCAFQHSSSGLSKFRTGASSGLEELRDISKYAYSGKLYEPDKDPGGVVKH